MRTLFKVGAYLLFFGWNLWFLSWIALGLGPMILFQLCVAVFTGMVPVSFGVFTLVLLVAPAFGLLLALHPTLRRDPGRLLSVFYGVQFPVMLLAAVRLFAVEQMTWPVGLSLAVVGLGAVALLRTLISGPREDQVPVQLLRLVAQSGYLLAGWWWALLASLYAASLGQGMLRIGAGIVWEILTGGEWFAGPGFLLLGGFIALTGFVVFVFPIAMVGIASRAWQLVARATAERIGWGATVGVTAVTVGAWLLAIVLTGLQPQGAAFAALDGATDDAGRRAAIERSDDIRDGLVFARLAAERTFESDPDGSHVYELWEATVGPLGEVPRFAWRVLMAPYIYHPAREGYQTEVSEGGRGWGPSAPTDVHEASVAYADFFDAPMEVAEREALIAGVTSTWSWQDARAGLLEVGQQKVHLDRQQIAVLPHGDVADVEIHDVYKNRTWERQEVLVHFSLPESAALTGLWLGPDDDRSKAFAYVVAPRGAAQEVYQREVQQRRDPALLEQVGPREYRLRAFPVEPRTGETDDVFSITAEGPELHLWLTATVPLAVDDEGAPYYPLPRSTEVRNLFWDRASARTLDGTAFSGDGWTPDRAAAPGAALAPHTTSVNGWIVRAEPAGAVTPGRIPHAVVLVDGTRSMERHRDEIAAALARIRSGSDKLTVKCIVEQRLATCDDFDAHTALFYGSTPLETRLVEGFRDGSDATALIVLTDEGSYSLAAAAEKAGLPDVALPPLWLVHFGSDPAAYPDWTLDRIQRTGGGVASSVDEVLVRLSDPAVRAGWRWSFADPPPVAVDAALVPPDAAPESPAPLTITDTPASPSDPFGPIAARALVAHLDQRQRSGALGALDAMHGVAVQNHVVSAYSSMIVLVDEAQMQRLREAEARDDRFDREVIDAQPEVQPVTAAPEPGALILLGIGGVAVALGTRRRRPARSSPPSSSVG